MDSFGDDAVAEKARFNVEPMPVYLTGGSEDAWFVNGTLDLNDWAALNECTGASTVTRLTLDGGKVANSLFDLQEAKPLWPALLVKAWAMGPTQEWLQ